MGKEEICAYQWTCDQCGRTKLLLGDDKDPPYGWVEEGILAFCSWSHHGDWHRKNDDDR